MIDYEFSVREIKPNVLIRKMVRFHSQPHGHTTLRPEIAALSFNFLGHVKITIATTPKQCYIPEATLVFLSPHLLHG